ncbi:aldehyde dehydrogenase (NADP(+)) [Leifsonia sp. Root112D2]|uniref:aldehyde dehydrogenase (NADP(+)) n=1 Tax=Leifsonia sp. Root112D2 TaxID=1736426 RepID=UPI0006FA9AA3|nr:aldehyde dehydrogenase (NADP(+)) [Leifsonia sp. Root112D2]KQV06510.1 aldehyde dehydrogenase [Leifsonia sp. Root112D2]
MISLHEATAGAAQAAAAAAAADDETRARWLEALADALDANAGELVGLADEESHLGAPRLGGEVARTTGQLRLFAGVVREGSYLEAVIDHADATATPPRPDLRRMLRPIGPVAVFSASNFPFAFSVLGGDTASALAVGCPVVVKAHSGHPRLSARVGALASQALDAAGAPRGLLSVIEGRQAGIDLVQSPTIKAVGFTGSLSGGRALYNLAAARDEPIPFYGELGSINPVVITARAATERGHILAEGLVGSFTLGVGQFCTKPGVVFYPAHSGFDERVIQALGERPEARMLTEHMADAFDSGSSTLGSHPDVDVLVQTSVTADTASPALYRTSAQAVSRDPATLLEEVFGPAALLVSYADDAELDAALDAITGTLTATLHSQPDENVTDLVDKLTALAGRVLFEGWPTGVAVTWSQQHGGPWPATTSLHTSVGATAVRRFLRPVAWQDAPERYLPIALRDENGLGIPRRVDGRLQLPRG